MSHLIKIDKSPNNFVKNISNNTNIFILKIYFNVSRFIKIYEFFVCIKQVWYQCNSPVFVTPVTFIKYRRFSIFNMYYHMHYRSVKVEQNVIKLMIIYIITE